MENISPKVEILGDITLISHNDGRTQTVRGVHLRTISDARSTDNPNANPSSTALMPVSAAADFVDKFTHRAALALTAVAGIRALWDLCELCPHPLRWLGRSITKLSSKSGSFTLPSFRRQLKAIRDERAAPNGTDDKGAAAPAHT